MVNPAPATGVVDIIHHHQVHGGMRIHVDADVDVPDVVGAGRGLGHAQAEL